MANVPQKTLNWLWDVLRREYSEPQRAYSDLAQTLALYPAFAPRTDVYTSENGVPALLLHLNGTLPVNFRGSLYRFPIAIWIPHGYPHESPIVYVDPTDDMAIRPGQHVSPSDGRIYHPYLAKWRDTSDRSTISDFLKLLADVFAREPPVMSRQQVPPQSQTLAPRPGQQQPPPRPPMPGEQRAPSAGSPSFAGGPPPPPPKQSDQIDAPRPPSAAPSEPAKRGRYDAPPPLPGQAPIQRPHSVASPPQAYSPQSQFTPQRQASLRQSMPPQQHPSVPSPYQQQRQPLAGQPPMPVQAQQQQVVPPTSQPQIQQQQFPPQRGPPPPQSQYLPPPQQGYLPQQAQPQYQPQFQQPKPKPKPQQPNIMDESPFDVSLPTTTASNLPTPAIPPNPEKQHILSNLQSTLLGTLQNQITQSSSALGPLQSQHHALQSAHQTLQAELNHLQTLHSQLQSNVSSLNSTLTSADRTITNARSSSSPDKIPPIDELIIPPTVVARQLYDNVAEQRGYEAAIYALTEGFVKGRIGGEMWARKMRECAREEFRRKWVVRRVGRGMGLDGDGIV